MVNNNCSVALARLGLQIHQRRVHINKELGIATLFVKVHNVHEEDVVEKLLAWSGLDRILHLCVSIAESADSVVKNLSTCVVAHNRSLGFSSRINNLDVTVSSWAQNFNFLPYQGRIHDLLGGLGLLNDYLSVYDSIFIDIGQVNLKQHKSCTVSMCLQKLFPEFYF